MSTTDRREVRVTVYDGEEFSHGGDWPPGNLAEAIAWLQERLDSVPPEYRDVVKVDFDSVSDGYGGHEAGIKIHYIRPETDEEMAARQARERRDAELRRQQEIQTLKTLQAKYGPQS